MFNHLRWLSIKNIWQNIQELALRFPLVSIDTALATVCGVILVDSAKLELSASTEHILTKILLMAVLGFPLLIAATLVSEKLKWNKIYYWLGQSTGLAILVVYYFVLPQNPDEFSLIHMTRLLILNIVMYLFALSFPFYEKNNSLKFWRFAEVVFARAVVAAFFSATLWVGIALSLAAIDYLFQANILGETYLKAFITIVGIFGAWFFLAGFPKTHEPQPEKMENSKVFKIFLQYICIPLLCVFFVILYVYLGKIVILWNWPKGGVADWILGFSSAGFLIYTLSYPLSHKNEHSWMSNFFRVFFILVLPMVAVLALAIYFRVSEYGVTESRYLVMLGGIWLFASSLYFLIAKQKELKFLPYLAAGFLFFAVLGPWSMYSVSIRSQSMRLNNLLAQYHLLENGHAVAVKDENTIPLKDRVSIYSKIQYLGEHDKVADLQILFPTVALSTSTSGRIDYDFSLNAMKVLNIINYYNYEASPLDQEYVYLNIAPSAAVDVQGFDTLIRNVNIYFGQGGLDNFEYTIASTTYTFQLQNNEIHVLENKEKIFSVGLSSYLKDWVEKYGENSGPMPQKTQQNAEIKVDVENSKEHLRFLFDSLSLHKNGASWDVQGGNMSVLIDFK